MTGMPSRVGVGVGVVVVRGDELLLVQRRHHGAGTWSTPGGYLDPGETPEEAAVRETREETGVEVDRPTFLALSNDVHPDGKHNVTLWFAARFVAGEAHLAAPDESLAVGWFPWDAPPGAIYLSLGNFLAGRTYPALASPRDAARSVDPG